ncbi:MAG: type II secretion system protein GspG [Planctomycetes bacterium]|nr:type II secretion system protein GspG [Planctomycetota bacterium]
MLKRLPGLRKSAFTLLELMIVLAIILVIAGSVGVIAYVKIKDSADRDAAKVLVDQVVHAVDIFHTKLNRYPASDKGLQELITAPEDENEAKKWGGPYLKDGKIPVDPWGSELKYELTETTGSSGTSTGPAFKVWSLGPDKQDGSDDDIRSWTEQK